MNCGEMVVQWHQAGKPLIPIKDAEITSMSRYLAHCIENQFDDEIERVRETMKHLKLYVCSECHSAQHRIIPPDYPMNCLECGENALEVRNG